MAGGAAVANPVLESHELEPKQSWCKRWFPLLQWNRTSPVKLKEAEEKFLSFVSTPSKGHYVDIGTLNGDPCRIWTRIFGAHKKTPEGTLPLVMVHGMAAGIAFFCFNFKDLSRDRPLYCIDLPGFARSSRPRFSSDHKEAEQQYIIALEEWRKKEGIDKMYLLGHSFGGYLSASYALKYPERVEHLILADPWGFPEMPKDLVQGGRFPWWIRGLYQVFKNFNPLAIFRMSGPFSYGLIQRMRPDLIRRFDELFDSEEQNFEVLTDYIYHCNVQKPTGETAFHSLMSGFAWAKEPMLPRLAALDDSVPLTALYGAESWVTAIQEETFNNVRGGKEGIHNRVELIQGASHHLYADNSAAFNLQVINACEWSDRRRQSKAQADPAVDVSVEDN